MRGDVPLPYTDRVFGSLVISGTVLAAGGYVYAGMAPQSQIFGPTLIAGSDPDEFALTYDDGPNDTCTEQLLEILARYDVRATFFMIGRFARQRASLVRQVRAGGHLIGNHTWSHPLLMTRSPRRVREELAATNAELEDILGERIRYFRPPHGGRRPDVLRAAREMGLVPVLWNAMGCDWRPISSTQILANLDRGISRNRRHGMGSNILLHDGGQAGIGQERSQTVVATKELLGSWSGRTRFVTVEHWGDEQNYDRASQD